jgi:hypothetical protein
MKKILALIVSVALCVTDVCAMPKNELILHENTQEQYPLNQRLTHRLLF